VPHRRIRLFLPASGDDDALSEVMLYPPHLPLIKDNAFLTTGHIKKEYIIHSKFLIMLLKTGIPKLDVLLDGGITSKSTRMYMYIIISCIAIFPSLVSASLQTNAPIIAPMITVPIINVTQLVASEITVSNTANLLGVLRGHSPLKIVDSIQYVDKDDTNLFSTYTAGENITGSNVSDQYYGVIIHQIETHTNPSGIEECWWDREDQEMRMCMDKRSIDMWNNLVVNKNIDITGNASAETGLFSYLGSSASRITRLWIVDIDATGNIETSQNVSAEYFKGDGSLLTNLPAGGEIDPMWSANFTNMQTDCPSTNYAYGVNGNGTLKCRQDQAGSGLTPVYLGSDLNATSAGYTTIFTIALTPSKMNIVQAYLAQSSPTNGVAIRNRAIINASGPIGNCNFVTQTGAGAHGVGNIAVSTNSADTGENTMTLGTNVPFINTVTCTVLADANQKDLIIQFNSETAANVTTYAGSYYTTAVN
jgi:hypothetical protein